MSEVKIPSTIIKDPQDNFSTSTTSQASQESVGTILYIDSIRRVVIVSTLDGKKVTVGFGAAIGLQGEGLEHLPASGKNWKVLLEDRKGTSYITKIVPPGSYLGENDQLLQSPFGVGSSSDIRQSITGLTSGFRSFVLNADTRKLNYRGSRFYDAIGGDFYVSQPEGNYLGVFRGGLNIMKASPYCWFRMFADGDLSQLFTRNFDMLTDWGRMRMESTPVGNRLVLQGNAGDNTAFDTRKGTYEFELQIGACQSNGELNGMAMSLQLITPSKGTLQLFISKDGEVALNLPRDLCVIGQENGSFIFQKSFSVITGEGMDIDAKTFSIKAGREVAETGSVITETVKPFSVSATSTGAFLGKEGEQGVRVSQNETLTGSGSGHKEVVQAPHLDKYNDLCKTLADIFNATSLGDMGIPIPISARTQKLKEVIDLLLTLQDRTNKTTHTKST